MDVRKYFEYHPELELTVAQIGINKWNWISIEAQNLKKAKEVMASHRFDVLPIEESGFCTKYFQTESWGNFEKVTMKEITEKDTLYYRLSFIDLLRKMLKEKKYSYFLADSEQILGLISLNNLNCLAVYNYIYQVTAALEKEVSTFLKLILSEADVIEMLEKTSDKQANRLVQEYHELKKINKENSIFEHTYFPTLGTLLKYAADKIPSDKKEILKYRKKFCAEQLYHRIRNCVSHPVKPLFVEEVAVAEVYELINDYLKIKTLLK